jgi:hypothetical protein
MGVQSFAESRRHDSRRRAPLQREPNIWLSAKSPSSTRARYLAVGEGVAPTANGGACRDGKKAFGESQGRLSAHVCREDPVKLLAKAILKDRYGEPERGGGVNGSR